MVAFIAVAALGAIVARLLLRRLDQLLVALIVIAVIALPGALVLEPGAAFAEHAEIMVRILQIIFGLDPVAGELGVARHALVFLQELGGVAALTVVLAVPRLSTEVLPPLSPTTAPAAALTIVDQIHVLTQ
jgi:hypothetical protein